MTMVFSLKKYKEYLYANGFTHKRADEWIGIFKWPHECNGLTPNEMRSLGFRYHIEWLVPKIENVE